MNALCRNLVQILCLLAGICPILAVADAGKTFSFENLEAYQPGPLKMSLERTHCIADPQRLAAEFGTPEAPRLIQKNQRAAALVMPAPAGANCPENGGSTFTVRFFKEASVDINVQGMPPRMSVVTFSLGEHSVVGIDNQGAGAFFLDNKGSKEVGAKDARYSVDWLPLTVARRDVVFFGDRKLEASLQCKNSRRSACKGRLLVSARAADFQSGALSPPVLLASGAFRIPFDGVKSVSLNITRAGRLLLGGSLDAQSSPPQVTVELSADFEGRTVSLATAKLPTVASAAQGGQMSLTVINNASSTVSACLYQLPEGPGLLPTVWLSSYIPPGMSKTFRWSGEDYAFVWSETGPIQPGINFSPSQIISAEPGNQISFTAVGGQAQFSGLNPTPSQPGLLSIASSATIPSKAYGIGVGLSGSTVYVAQAQPNQVTQFPIPSRTIYLFAGDCRGGDVLDSQAIPNAARISYDQETRGTATLQANRQWSVVMGSGL